MTREQLIEELEKGLEQLKGMRHYDDQKVYHRVDLGFYTDHHKEIGDFSLDFFEEYGEIFIDYTVEEIEE